MNKRAYFDKTQQEYELKNLRKKVKEYESGEKYVKMKKEFLKTFRAHEREINRLKKDLGKAHAENVSMRKCWSEVFDDMEAEHKKELEKMQTEIRKHEKKNIEMARQRDAALDKVRDTKKELYKVKCELYEATQKIEALNIRIKKNYKNSSKPSSQEPNHPKIPNGREKSGKNPGGQSGHKHHPRKKPEKITKEIHIAPTEEMRNNPDLRRTKNTKEKYLIKCYLTVEVLKYVADEYRNIKTGSRVYAPFPNNLKDEINYDGTVKACAYLLKDKCNVSIGNVQQFLREISHNEINLSTGMISNLTKEFSEKTEKERDEIYLELYNSPTLHADFTFGRVNGKQGTVMICANEDGAVLYQRKDKKGDEGVKGSPLEHYEGTTITDHESALIKRGTRHQDCTIHIRRELVASEEIEKNLTWNSRMKKWIDEATKYRDNVVAGIEPESQKKDEEYLREFDEILKKAKEEYEYEPPNAYYRKGYNLYKRMEENPEDYVLFIRDKSVCPNNNLAERYARKYKRKNIQVMCFRSKAGVENFCNGLSVVETLKNKKENLFEAVTERFNGKQGSGQ